MHRVLGGLVKVRMRRSNCAAGHRLPILDDAKRTHGRLALLLERGRVGMRLGLVTRSHGDARGGH